MVSVSKTDLRHEWQTNFAAEGKRKAVNLMGQHKHNPTAIAAKNSELPPKPPKMTKREKERIIYSEIEAKMCEYFLKRLTGRKGG
jgi:hypothetical protein